jgi:hypothetical protein
MIIITCQTSSNTLFFWLRDARSACRLWDADTLYEILNRFQCFEAQITTSGLVGK